eukprot:CAMPEP_0172671918 /NCGR_PEP_ID=MMETSP1074-20121228/11217_1 /TAXON_ID=2916 /ORGANISM="Ceratium fusus, Strain PA161109" /LENGTH=891 /DNA_ID=CAMNT_0013489031 /DNA_START=403 /DNA_END=3078 /DNA_ORIENTATION=-
MTCVAIALCVTEITIATIIGRESFLGFFFLLDVVATASLVLDITFVWNFLMGYESFSVKSSSRYATTDGGVAQASYARAGRSSRIGVRLARSLRVFRLIRMIRVFKFWSLLIHQWSRRKLGTNVQPGEFEVEMAKSGSLVGKKLSERTTISVICVVILMLVVVPVLDPGRDAQQNMSQSSPKYGIEDINQAWEEYVAEDAVNISVRQFRRSVWEERVLLFAYYHHHFGDCPDNDPVNAIDCASDLLHKLCFIGYIHRGISGDAVDNHFIQTFPLGEWDSLFGEGHNEQHYVAGSLPDHAKQKLASPWQVACGGEGDGVNIVGVSFVESTDCPWRSVFRLQEIAWYLPSSAAEDKESFIVFFDVSKETRHQAMFSIGQTVFIIVMLFVASWDISRSLDRIVLHPIERMINTVQRIRADPLSVMSQLPETGEPQLTSRLGRCSGCLRGKCCGRRPRRQRQPTLETKILENMIIKLGHLLALGFGEAGSLIIFRNLENDDEGVNAIHPGCRVEVICGVCKIQDFNVLTEVLQEKTMVFVNRVAKLVHSIVVGHLGASNKNLGDGFMLVWRMGGLDAGPRARTAELSVISFVQIVSAVTRDEQLAAFREHPMLLARLGKRRVGLSFGLHLGWSIEGAIGSEVKIDASYLSADVHFASILRAATRHYGVMILMSEALVRTCSRSLSCLLRPVDRVQFQGTRQHPTRLFTIDLDVEALIPWVEDVRVVTRRASRHSRTLRDLSSARKRCQSDAILAGTPRRCLDKATQKKLWGESEPHELFSTDLHLRQMRTIYTAEFCQIYERGYLNYEAGEWPIASRDLLQTRSMLLSRPADGPSSALLAYMHSHDNAAPRNWPGYCKLSLEDSKRPLHQTCAKTSVLGGVVQGTPRSVGGYTTL